MLMQDRVRWADFASLCVSAVAAALAPLQTLLIAFALIGPLHYFTEIAWLGKKQFYLRESKLPVWLYVPLSVVLVASAVATQQLHHNMWFWAVNVALVLSLLVLVRNAAVMLLIAAAATIAGFQLKPWVFVVSLLVPTVLHVFVFTWTFMVSGVLRDQRRAHNNAVTKWINPALMLLLPLALVVVPMWVPMHTAQPGSLALRVEDWTFADMHTTLARGLHRSLQLNSHLLADPVIAAMVRVFAFIYLFHYLNWFAKTELIEWHRIKPRYWVSIGLLYAALLATYAWSLKVGLIVASFFSLLHVLLEFPLNWRTLQFLARYRDGRAAKQPLREVAAR